jgi:pantoate--beta-alanine ligase
MDPRVIQGEIERMISFEPLAVLDYVAIVDLDNLEPSDKIEEETLIAVAVYFGKVRLIDNIIVHKRNEMP